MKEEGRGERGHKVEVNRESMRDRERQREYIYLESTQQSTHTLVLK
jgi:hypothetical protein